MVVLQVFLGLHDAGDKRVATNRSVEQIFLHPDFQPDNYNNDIALLRLTERVEFTQLIQPVCLPPPHSKVPQTLLPSTTTDTVDYNRYQNHSYWTAVFSGAAHVDCSYKVKTEFFQLDRQ